MNIKQGDVIQSARWPEPVEVQRIDDLGDGYIRLIGVTTASRKAIDQTLEAADLAEAVVRRAETLFNANPVHVFLSLEAKRYRYADLYDPLLAMNSSKVDPLPHQIEAVYGHVLKLPRIRFLIADDPGAGKTIMAGLIIKELKLRRLVKRILIVVPGHLKDQWQRELKERFDETFTVVTRGFIDGLFGENPWEKAHQIITSLDFAKRDEIRSTLKLTRFDLVIADEAHKMSAYRYGDKTDKTARYRLGETLSHIGEHLLFLTATPHKGDPENFRLFLDLLEPGFFADADMLQESISSKNNPLFIRRVKEDLKDFDGKPLFLNRYVKTLPFNLGVHSPDEKDLYNRLSEYVNTQYNKALVADKKRNVAFALVILQRRFASSVYALLRSLERRTKRLTEILQNVEEKDQREPGILDFEEAEDLNEEDRWKEEEYWETLSVAKNKQELQREIQTLESLAQEASRIIQQESELKVRELKKTLEELSDKHPDQKILIFTESKDTMEYLTKRLRSWGYTVNNIHGGMRLADRIAEEKRFKNETQVLVATEAAGEGINLQFCNLMINYDIPWNPNRLEQRMGRVHRYGQMREVYVFNLVAEDTREGKVLKKLFDKLEEIRDAMGSDKVFDVLSEVLYGKNLAQILMEAAANARTLEDIIKEIDIRVDDAYVARIKENLGDTLATRYIDYTRIKEMAQKAKESRLIPEYTQAFFEKVLQLEGGKLSKRKDGLFAVETVPFEIRHAGDDEAFAMRFGSVARTYPKITFDKDVAFRNPEAEFLCFGHPLFEAAMTYVERRFADAARQGAVFEDPDGKLDGFILFYDGEIADGKGGVAGKRLFAIYLQRETMDAAFVNPAVLWDLAPSDTPDASHSLAQDDFHQLQQKASRSLLPILGEYRKELQTERARQAGVKKKYGIASLESLILRYDRELIDLKDRKDKGENVDLAIRNKESGKTYYEKALEKLKKEIDQEQTLTMESPRFVGVIRVVPKQSDSPGMRRDDEVEAVGMRVAMEYEAAHGRIPEDVSAQNIGFDIRSTDANAGVRYIEVKARAATGDIELTQNEWFKAKRFGDDYYLYVVFNASSKPELIAVRNPAVNLDAIEKIELVRYVVDAAQVFLRGRTT
ncbi:MAG: helicase-related protein [Desulfomonilaceae bacterium]